MNTPFLKMHGLGNDFVIIDSRSDGIIPDQKIRMAISDRRRGVGCDQLIYLTKPRTNDADVFMNIYNPDGSEAGACGNATRCVARLLFEETGRDSGIVETISGLLKVRAKGNGIYSVDFGEPRLQWNEIPLAEAMDTVTVKIRVGDLSDPCCVNMGNPHAVFFVPNAEAVPLSEVGPKLEHHPAFPQRCNIEFAQIIDRGHIRMRVWERGAGITQACGTGACATLVSAVRRNLSDRNAIIILDGGELNIEWREDNHVIMAGSATLSFKGTLDQIL